MFRALLYGLIPLVLASTNSQISTPNATATIPSLSVTGDTTAPSTPILIAPLNHSIIDNSSPTFIWRRSSDTHSNTVIYSLSLNGLVTFTNIVDSGNSIAPTYTTRQEGQNIFLTPVSALADGSYTWYVSVRDLSQNTVSSAIWNFTLDTSPPPLTATVSQLQPTNYNLLLMILILIAVFIILLLILLRKRRYNLILLNSDFQPHSHAIIYHSRSSKLGFYRLSPSQHGRLYLPHLARYSTLTIRVIEDSVCTTHILSISAPARHYTIVL